MTVVSSDNRYSLEGRVALVTGAARGIGFGIAQELIHQGARVVITDLSDEALVDAKASFRLSVEPLNWL